MRRSIQDAIGLVMDENSLPLENVVNLEAPADALVNIDKLTYDVNSVIVKAWSDAGYDHSGFPGPIVEYMRRVGMIAP